ncbi:hypothetical protein F5Y17DRAFT_116085 [Xylariaceae sp. FL0594]|nr:hypothetical protein F5Y17DRAFT_116085 [Xylariaceae sp. FL0594]
MENHEQATTRLDHQMPPWQPISRRRLDMVTMLLGADGSLQSVSDYRRRALGSPFPVESSENPAGGPAAVDSLSGLEDVSIETPYKILVPDWFVHLDKQRAFKTAGNTIEARFRYLNNVIYTLEDRKEQLEYEKKHPGEAARNQREWPKNWHLPHPGWPHEHQRREGGLWKCRKGRDATDAEKACTECDNQPVPPLPLSETHPDLLLKNIMMIIGEAMAAVAEKDKAKLGARNPGDSESTPSPSESSDNTDAIKFCGDQSQAGPIPRRGLGEVSQWAAKLDTDSQQQQPIVEVSEPEPETKPELRWELMMTRHRQSVIVDDKIKETQFRPSTFP